MDAARRRRLGLLAALLAVAAATAIALALNHRLGPKHLLTVTPDVLYRSGQLTPEQLADVITRNGVRTVVNLRSENEMQRGDWHARERATAKALGARVVDLPMNTGFPPRNTELERWLALLDDPDAHPMLVHCEYGVIRTGIMVAIYEIERLGLGVEQALARFEVFGRELPEVIQGRIDAYFDAYVPRHPPS